jgi:flagellar hook assembly protein FlgD
LRNLLTALAVVLLAALGVAAPVSAAQTSTAKVVIIVGATHGATAGYRTSADAAYAEAIKYTARVTKVYSPNATWSKVKAATQGANIVIYFGHGNGWPSPYTYDPLYTTKDGFGLNYDLNGDGKLSDYENKYYGEPAMAQLGLAPNAIVMLHSLCYASGNSEPGGAAPSVSVARQRIDNYAAGFLKGGARAVLADGHMGPASYLRAMFTTDQSLLSVWRTAPNFHNHVATFASTRSPGYTAYSDPDTTTAGYYRSLVTAAGLSTTAITKAVGDTGGDPASLVVPGRASALTPIDPAAAVAGDVPLLELPAGTRLKTIAIASPATASSPAIVQVVGLDDPSIEGFVSAATLAPRDSKAPVLLGSETGTSRFSPNGDGRFDAQRIAGTFSENVTWSLSITDPAGGVVKQATGTGSVFDVAWDGLVDGVAVADGTYSWSARGVDAWQNGVATGGGSLVVDTVGVAITSLTPDESVVSVFSPNGDGVGDTVATTVTTAEAGTVAVRVIDVAGATTKSWTVTSVAGANAIRWDGKDASGATVPEGTYTLRFTARDGAGTNGSFKQRDVTVVRFLSAVRSSAKVFFPQDGDRFARTTSLSFSLARPATVSWTIRNAAGTTVATRLSDAATAAGTQTWAWDGRGDAGTLLPTGVYTATVSATSADTSISQSVKVEMNAFAIATSTATPRRGGRVTISVTSAEALSGSVRLYVTQSGVTTWAVTMTKVDSRNFKATITLKSGGTAGKVTFKVWAHDYDGRTQATSRVLPLS